MKQKPKQSGSVLIAIIVMFPFLILIVALYTELTINGFRLAKVDQSHTYAQLATDAGIDAAMEQINQDNTWTGTGGEVTLQNDTAVRTTYQVNVADVDAEHKTVASTGRTFRPASATTPESSVTVTASVRAVRSGEYSIVSGVGGLVMRNSSKIVNGSVYINGDLTMSNTSQIGLSILPVDVKVAHQTCPSPATATYPRVCASNENGQPITLNNSAHIYGKVEATNQTNGSGMTNSGLVPGSTVPVIPLPIYDRDAQKAAVANNMTGAAAGCSVGLKTWPANLKITGNVTLSNLCAVTVEGNVWITGNFDMRNLASLRVKTGLTTPPVIMIDGSSGLNMRNSSIMLPNLGLVGFRVITYYSTASCSPDCAAVTGTDLSNSESRVTIDIDNSASGAQTEFYSRWTKLTAGNSGAVGALVGQSIELKNSLAVTFGTSVTGFGDVVWIIDSYRRTF